jgi:all-trans-retinol 13,14-reductase
LSFEFIIVGSGLGGLLTGYMLSKEGMKVCVLEKHRKFGGSLQSFRRGEHVFDTGMHYVGSLEPGQTLHSYWKYFGLTNLPWMQMDTNCFDMISFPDAEYPLAQGFDNFRTRLSSILPGTENALKLYTDTLREIAAAHPLYNLELPDPGMTDFYNVQKASDFLDSTLSNIEQRKSNIEHRLSGILAGNNFLYAGHPATTPLHQFGLINHSFISSAWRPAGGSQQVADKLVTGITANGGEVLAKKEVTRIASEGGGFIVETSDGDRFSAGQVISDIHPASTLKLLDGIPVQKAFAARVGGLENTVSVFSIYLGLKAGKFRYLNHNVYHHLTDRVWASEESEERTWPSGFILMTPPVPGQGEWADTAVILSPVKYETYSRWENSVTGRRERDYWIFRAQQSQRLLETVYSKFPELRDAVDSVDISTPLTWRDYTGTPGGSVYGIAKSAADPHRTTIYPRTKIPGLYFTGQSVNLHGAVGVTIGAVMTCGEVIGLPNLLKKIRNAI